MADLAAKAAHDLDCITEAPVCKTEKVRWLTNRIMYDWREYWFREVFSTGKGKPLFLLKDDPAFWEWTSHPMRSFETALAKFRIGHVGLNSHLHRFNIVGTDLCNCGEVETISHFIFQCPQYDELRTTMFEEFQKLGIPLTLRNLLGAGNYVLAIQRKILEVSKCSWLRVEDWGTCSCQTWWFKVDKVLDYVHM